jgi:hypothetical protein
MRLAVALCCVLLVPAADTMPQEPAWRLLEPGLELGSFAAGDGSPISSLHVLRIDPARFALRLLCASAPDQGEPRTARGWCAAAGLVAAVNAGMYQQDLRTSVGLMRTRRHVNNPRRSRQRAVLAFDPLEDGLPPLRILDLECDDFAAEAGRWGTLVQSIRMLSCRGTNVWRNDAGRWNAALAGIDIQGRLLLIYAAVPVGMRGLIDTLVALPLDLQRVLYLEGGPPAQLYVHSGDFEFDLAGPAGLRAPAAPIPNVLGVVRR